MTASAPALDVIASRFLAVRRGFSVRSGRNRDDEPACFLLKSQFPQFPQFFLNYAGEGDSFPVLRNMGNGGGELSATTAETAETAGRVEDERMLGSAPLAPLFPRARASEKTSSHRPAALAAPGCPADGPCSGRASLAVRVALGTLGGR